MAITQLDPTSGYNLKRYRDASGRLLPINRTGGIVQPATTNVGLRSMPVPGRGMVKYNPYSMNNILNIIKNPAALRTMGLIPGLGVGAGLLGAGSLAYSLLSDDDKEINIEKEIYSARENKPWVARALNPNTPTTENNETVRTAHGKHSKTGKWIVYPTIRSVSGELVTLSDAKAKEMAETRGDFVSMPNEKSALEFSKGLSNTINISRDRERNTGLLT